MKYSENAKMNYLIALRLKIWKKRTGGYYTFLVLVYLLGLLILILVQDSENKVVDQLWRKFAKIEFPMSRKQSDSECQFKEFQWHKFSWCQSNVIRMTWPLGKKCAVRGLSCAFVLQWCICSCLCKSFSNHPSLTDCFPLHEIVKLYLFPHIQSSRYHFAKFTWNSQTLSFPSYSVFKISLGKIYIVKHYHFPHIQSSRYRLEKFTWNC